MSNSPTPTGPGIRSEEANYDLDGRRLTGAVLAEQAVELARLNREGDVVDSDRLPKLSHEPPSPDGGGGDLTFSTVGSWVSGWVTGESIDGIGR